MVSSLLLVYRSKNKVSRSVRMCRASRYDARWMVARLVDEDKGNGAAECTRTHRFVVVKKEKEKKKKDIVETDISDRIRDGW